MGAVGWRIREVGEGVVTLSMFLAVLGGIRMEHTCISHIYTGYRVRTCVYVGV